MSGADTIADSELPAELPASFKGAKRMTVHFNYGRDGGAAIYRWHDADGRAWPIQEQYDTRKAKPASGKKPAFEPPKTGVVIIDSKQPSGFYGPVCSDYSQLREVWKRWRAGLPDEEAGDASTPPTTTGATMDKKFPEPQPFTDKPRPQIALQPVESHQIGAIGYDEATKTLAVQFRRGARAIYHYPNVERATYEAFKGAESIGTYFGQHLKALPFEKFQNDQPAEAAA